MSNFHVGDRVIIVRNQRETHSLFSDYGDLYREGDVGTIVEISLTNGFDEPIDLPYLVNFDVAHGERRTYENRVWWVGRHEIEHEIVSPEAKAERERWAKMSPVERKIEKLWKRSNYVKSGGKEHVTI